jgi:hypothetical protein
VFAVYCNIDLCQLVCEIDKLYKLLPTKCGTVENTEVKDKLLRINTLLGQCFIGINQPLCGIDVPALIEEIKKIGGFTCNCGTSGGINAIGVTDGDITITTVTTGAITASVTNVGNNYTLNLSVPGATAGTLQQVTDNGNTTTNDIIVGDPAGVHTTMENLRLLVEKTGSGGVVAGIGLSNTSQTSGRVWVGTVSFGQFYIQAHPSQNTYAIVVPANQGGAGTTLINDGAGNLSWVASGAASLQAVTTVGATTTNAMYGTGIGFAVTDATNTYTALPTDFEILCDLTSASKVITLPIIQGQVYCIKLYGSVPSGRTVTIDVSGGGTIDGAASITLNRANQSVIVQCIRPNEYSVLAYSSAGLNLQQVTDAGNTTTNTMISGSIVAQYSSVSAGVVLAANSTLASASLVATGSSSTLNLKSTGAAFSNALKAEDGILAARVTQLPTGRSGTLAMIGNLVSPTVGSITAAAGVGATLVVAAGSDDNKGRVTLTTGTGCGTGQLFTVVFNTPNPVSAYAAVSVLIPQNAASLNVQTIVQCTSDPLQFGAAAIGSPLVDSTVYVWNYIVQR